MATTLTLQPVARWCISAESATAQGADGVQQLADTAYANLLNAQWERDDNEPTLPVHEYDRPKPYGQAYKAVWGYDAEARTERSCCGAVCYTYKIPTDALDATKGKAKIVSIKTKLAVDRYCDEGVSLGFSMLASKQPEEPMIALKHNDAVNIFATKTQVDAEGNPLPPNKRAGITDYYVHTLPQVDSTAYCNVYLMMSDYTSVRGAWIEGGGMFAEDSITVTFDRDVAQDETSDAFCLMNIGANFSNGELLNEDAFVSECLIRECPIVSMYATYIFTVLSGGLEPITDYTKAKLSALAMSQINPDVIDGQADSSTQYGGNAFFLTMGNTAYCGMSETPAGFDDLIYDMAAHIPTFICHGATNKRVFNGIRFANPMPLNARLVIYRIDTKLAIEEKSGGRMYATPILWWGTLMQQDWRDGVATEARALTGVQSLIQHFAWGTMGEPIYGQENTVVFDVSPVLCTDVQQGMQDFTFRDQLQTDDFTSLIITVLPTTESIPYGGQKICFGDVSLF